MTTTTARPRRYRLARAHCRDCGQTIIRAKRYLDDGGSWLDPHWEHSESGSRFCHSDYAPFPYDEMVATVDHDGIEWKHEEW